MNGPDPHDSGDGSSTPSPGPRAADSPFATELNRRLGRLAQWAAAAEAFSVELPTLPPWAVEAASHSRSPEPWAEVVRGVERLAQRRLAEAFDHWQERMSARIARLEAYAVDSRLERGQIEDAVHAAKTGDVAQALATYHQVERVVALKERHLDQARGDLERLVAFLRDLEVLGLVEPGEPAEVAAELERELRSMRLASLKARLRQLRAQATERTSEALAECVARLGNPLLSDRRTGARTVDEARELAMAARAVVVGRVEEGARRLRAFQEARGLSPPPRGPGPGHTA
jgi:hypothetical protein